MMSLTQCGARSAASRCDSLGDGDASIGYRSERSDNARENVSSAALLAG